MRGEKRVERGVRSLGGVEGDNEPGVKSREESKKTRQRKREKRM